MKGFITMIRDISDVAYDASAATIINAAAIASIGEKTWGEATIGTIKLLEPSANDISGLLFGNTIIQGTDLSGLTIGDNNQALNEYSIALGQGAVASGTAGFVYRDRDNNTFVFDSGGSTGAGNLLINGTNPEGGGGTLPQDIPNNLDVSGTIEASGVILAPVHSAEGSSQSVITELDPSKNPLMTKGMYWINEAQDKSAGWSYVAPMDISRAGLGVAALGGKLYAVGGYDVFTSPAPMWQGASGAVYDPITTLWEPIGGMDISRARLGLAALGGKLYAVGGVNGDPYAGAAGGTNFLSSAEVYDPSTNSWELIASMDISRASLGLAALGGKLYAVGGYNAGQQQASDGRVYDPITNNWEPIASMHVSRTGLGLISSGGKLYAMGGNGDGTAGTGGVPGTAASNFNSIEVYDPLIDSWILHSNAMIISKSYMGVAALGGKIYTVGGEPSTAGLSGEVYDPLTRISELIAPMDISRSYLGLAALGGKLYAVGGFNTYVPGNSVEVYDPSLVQMPQITYRGEDFYISHARGGPKTFVIPHPEHEGKMLRHACLEAPTRGTNVYEYQITTTEDNQTTEIDLPSYFKHINGRARVYVSASEQNGWGDCRGAVNDELTTAIIETEKSGIYNVMITGVRKDPEAVAYSATENIDEPIDAKDI
jgi:N-acetylneuraminic acid mutarotase